MAEYLFNPAPAKDVADWIRQKLPLRRDQFEKLLPELHARAFVVSGVNAFDALQDIRDTVAKLPEGALFKNVQKEVALKLAGYIDAEQLDLLPRDEAELVAYEKQLQRRAGFLIRHHGNQAYAVATHADLEEHGDVFTHWKYLTVGDGHVRDTHRALDGLILPKSHEFWKTHFPPWQFGCRCQVVPVTTKEYEAYVKLDEGKALVDRFTLTEAEQLRLTNERKLQRKIGGVETDVDLRSDTEKGAEFPYIFDPSSLKLPLTSIRERYDDSVWNAFESWAKTTKIGGNTTVWQWLEGEQAVLRPAVSVKVGEVTNVEEFLKKLKIGKTGDVTRAQMTQLMEELRESNPFNAVEAFSSIEADAYLSEQVMLKAAQEFFNYLPSATAAQLPKIKLMVEYVPKGNYLGYYEHGTKRLVLNSAHLASVSFEAQVETVIHELVHWVHISGIRIPGLNTFAGKIRALFARRVKREKLKTLYPSVKGYEDQWLDLDGSVYAGAVYPSEDPRHAFGIEVPSTTLEKLAHGPDKLMAYMNFKHPISGNYAWREAFTASLDLFFNTPTK